MPSAPLNSPVMSSNVRPFVGEANPGEGEGEQSHSHKKDPSSRNILSDAEKLVHVRLD